MKNKKFWQWKNQSEDEGRARILELSGTIAEESWFDDDVTPEQFKDELFADSGEVTIWINSPGGDCIAASRIYAMLMDYPGAITVKIDGIAASAASVIAMAGTKVLMAPTALMMIHNPMTLAYGNHQDMQKAIGMLDEVKESIVNAYEIKTNLTRAKISHLMDNETWMNAKKAIELGFADAILEDAKKASNEASYAFSMRTSQLSLMNKITETYAIAEDQEPPEEGTTGLNELEKRLNLIKPQCRFFFPNGCERRQIASLCAEVFNGRRSAELYSEYGHWLFYITDIYLPCCDSESGDFRHLPFTGSLMDQPYMSMQILKLIQLSYRRHLHEQAKKLTQKH